MENGSYTVQETPNRKGRDLGRSKIFQVSYYGSIYEKVLHSEGFFVCREKHLPFETPQNHGFRDRRVMKYLVPVLRLATSPDPGCTQCTPRDPLLHFKC